MRVVTLTGGVALLLAFAPPTPCLAQNAPRTTLRPALLPFVGAGGFPRPRDIESGATDAGQVLAGAPLDLPIAPQLLLAITIARGFQPVACAGGCAPDGSLANVAILWLPASVQTKWGVLLGPSAERTTFDGTRTGVGVTVAIGALRGLGPRVTLRYHTIGGPRRASSLAGFLAIRLGP